MGDKRVFTPEHRAALSAALTGRKLTPEHIAHSRSGLRGKRRKDAVGYAGTHDRANVALPRVCAHCGTSEGRLECALDHENVPARNLRRGMNGSRELAYSIDVADYMRLCVPCHRRFDRSSRGGDARQT